MKFGFLLFIACFLSGCSEGWEANPPLEVSIIPSGAITIKSVDLYWSEFEGDDFDRYEIYFKSAFEKEFKLILLLKAASRYLQLYTAFHLIRHIRFL